MSRLRPILGSLVFLVVAPGIVAGLIPLAISGADGDSPAVLRILGWVLVVGGVLSLLGSFARFALQGLGTPAPVAPTEHLVVTGSYRFVRNPMYIAVVAIIVGQAAIFGDVNVLIYGAVVWGTVAAFVAVYEQPTLRRQFGAEYEAYLAAVPAWIPRLTPWDPPGAQSSPRSSE